MSSLKASELTIEQAVHGYSHGHRLLNSSCTLSIPAQRTLLALSDFSGDLTEGFDEYLTGYPVPESEYYAFARTWYAPEMDRPGSVWTHSLLIPRTDFQSITNLHSLNSLFVKPEKGKPTSTYCQSIVYESLPRENKSFILPYGDSEQDQFWRFLYSLVFKGLYDDLESVVLLAQNSSLYEQFVLSVWSQQWPALRSNFTFSTGSLEPRTLGSRPFDLQVTPARNQSFFASRQNGFVILNPDVMNLEETPSPSNHRRFFQKFDPQKRFVWHYGARMKGKRDNFGWLARLFVLTEEARYNPDHISKVTDFLAFRFPEPQEMVDLKASLFGGKGSERPVVGALGEEQLLLKELVETSHGHIFDSDYLNVADRTKALWNTSPTAIRRIVKFYNDNLEMNAIRSTFFTSLANSLTPQEAHSFLKDNRELMLFLWRSNPNLVAQRDVWQSNDEISDKALELLLGASKNGLQAPAFLDWQLIVNSMVFEDSERYVKELDHILQNQLVDLVLNAHATIPQGQTLGEAWLRYISRHGMTALHWAVNNHNLIFTKALIATQLSPDSPEVLNCGSRPWLDLSRLARNSLGQPQLTAVMGFLLSLGFRRVDENASKLVEDSFQTVHDAAASDGLSVKTWAQLQHLAPSRAFFFEWDKCRRLEEALISWTITYGWKPSVIVLAAKSPGTLWSVLSRATDSYEKRAIVQSIRQDFEAGVLNISPESREVLESYFD